MVFRQTARRTVLRCSGYVFGLYVATRHSRMLELQDRRPANWTGQGVRGERRDALVGPAHDIQTVAASPFGRSAVLACWSGWGAYRHELLRGEEIAALGALLAGQTTRRAAAPRPSSPGLRSLCWTISAAICRGRPFVKGRCQRPGALFLAVAIVRCRDVPGCRTLASQFAATRRQHPPTRCRPRRELRAPHGRRLGTGLGAPMDLTARVGRGAPAADGTPSIALLRLSG